MYHDDPEVQAHLQRLEQLMNSRYSINILKTFILWIISLWQCTIIRSPLAQIEIPAELTPDRVLEIIAALMNGMDRAMEEAIKEAKLNGMKDVNKEMHLWQEK